VPEGRDVAAFGRRARSYHDGWLGRFHHEVAQRVASVAESAGTRPRHVLDVEVQDGEFDLVVSTTSFDHWHDQAARLRGYARVLDHNGVLVVADLFAPVLVLVPTLMGTRRDKVAREPAQSG